MASLKKRDCYYYGRWRKLENGKRTEVTKSMGIRYKDKAKEALEKLEQLEETGQINPYSPNFNPQTILEEQTHPKQDVPITTVREAADYFYKLKAHLSKKTVSGSKKSSKRDAYERAIEHFISLNHLETTSPKRIYIEHFEAVIFKPNIAPATRHFYYRQLRTFWNLLLERKIVENDYFPTLKRHLPSKKSKMRSKMLSKVELNQLFEAFDRETERKKNLSEWRSYYAQQWFKPVICCYFYGGLRKHEVAFSSDIPYSGLRGKNLFYEEEELSAVVLEATKGRRERLVPVSKPWRMQLQQYIELRGKPTYEEYLFIYLYGPKKGWPVTGQRVYKQFKRYLKLAGLPMSRTLHGMRHGRITDWLETGYNTSEAQFMAGHSSSNVTRT